MKVGVVVEGRSEFRGLPELRSQIMSTTRATALSVLYSSYDPNAAPGQIARECESRIKQFAGRNYDRAVVLIDRETRQEKCCDRAKALEAAIAARQLGIPVSVVVKDRMFENWLVADPSALAKMKARFSVSESMIRKVSPNKADSVDALALLRKAAQGSEYGKVDDSRRILEKASVQSMAQNSRSFRCFLARLGHPEFQEGSCTPLGA